MNAYDITHALAILVSGAMLIIPYKCYIVTTGLIVTLFCFIPKDYFILFLVIGVLVSALGLWLLCNSLRKTVPSDELKAELPK